MSNQDFELVRGSGNVFRDLDHPDADREQLRALLAARIIGVLDDRKLTVREAHELTGIAAADFSRIRKVKLDRFTIDRLMSILAHLGQAVEVTVNVHPRRDAKGEVEARLSVRQQQGQPKAKRGDVVSGERRAVPGRDRERMR